MALVRDNDTNTTLPKVLVTGATGFLGKVTVAALSDAGMKVRILARDIGKTAALDSYEVDVVVGDITSGPDLDIALEDIDIVVHMAADMTGSEAGGEKVTLGGTKLIIEKSLRAGVNRFIYVSSCSVYQLAGVAENSIIDEFSELESQPERRGSYSKYKHLSLIHI